jgi:hypothetical protein
MREPVMKNVSCLGGRYLSYPGKPPKGAGVDNYIAVALKFCPVVAVRNPICE